MYGAMSRRGLIIAASCLLLVLGLTMWGGSCIGAARAKSDEPSAWTRLSKLQTASAGLQRDVTALRDQLSSAETELSQGQSTVTGLRQHNTTLRTQLSSTEAELYQVQGRYGGLQENNAALRTQLASAETELSQLRLAYSGLQRENAAIRSQVTSLKSDYDSLMARYSILEKAKEFTVDSRLRVRLSTEVQLGTVTWVRGEVTNTGSTTVQRVYILVSRYKPDGSLERLDLPPTVILNLAPGGIGYFSILTAGENSKVTVLGDY